MTSYQKDKEGLRGDDAETQAQQELREDGFRERTAGQQALPTTATGTAKRSVRKLSNFIRENNGFTITSDTYEPASGGFVVAPVKSAEIIVDKDIPRSVLREYIQNARDLASSLDREVFMGGWFNSDDSKYYLDNVIIVDNKEEALYR